MSERSLDLRSRLKHAWNAFRSRDPTGIHIRELGSSSYSRPDRPTRRRSNETSIVNSIHNRIAIDVSAISIRHVRTDETGSYDSDMISGLQECITVEANIDQTGRALIQDLVMSMFDEGVVACVPVQVDSDDPTKTGSYTIEQLRIGKIVQWYPQHVMVNLYNQETGYREDVIVPKKMTAIIENPLFAVMNEPNSTLQRLIRKLNILDAIDEQSGSGKLDIIIQLPYVIKTEARRQQAETRRKDIEMQLSGSKYGIAYTDGTERITQLNRPADNNLLTQITFLTSMLYGQLGITESVFNGSADEATMLNYMSRTIEPILSAIVDEFKRKFLTKTARTQYQSVMYFKDVFKLVPANELANVADKYTRNEILSPNEMRSIIGRKPSKDPEADALRNRNLNQSTTESDAMTFDQTLKLFEVIIQNSEQLEKLDPNTKPIITNVMNAINNKIK